MPQDAGIKGPASHRRLIAFPPAGRLQENVERDRKAGEYRTDAAAFRAYGMALVGPPSSIDDGKR